MTDSLPQTSICFSADNASWWSAVHVAVAYISLKSWWQSSVDLGGKKMHIKSSAIKKWVTSAPMTLWAVRWCVMPLRFGSRVPSSSPGSWTFPLLSYLNKRQKTAKKKKESDSIRILVPQIQYLVHPRMIIIPALTHHIHFKLEWLSL